ncbi:MAG: hypothetical protein ACYDAG_19415, partial [Chloroflexota bacterium]
MSERPVSFIIRLWLEAADQRRPDWRWRVVHVQSGTERYGRNWEELSAFIGQRASVDPPGGAAIA